MAARCRRGRPGRTLRARNLLASPAVRTHFTAEIRVLLCEGCGAPLEAPVAGGQFACTYCRAMNVVSTRDERPTLGMPAMPVPIDENERIRRLRMQDGRPLMPPPSLMPLFPNGQIEPWRVQEVFTVFQQTRKEVKATHSPDAAERLYFITLIVSNYLGEQNDLPRLRALLETSLDTLELPRHKQMIRGMLSRNAVREGDLMAAERWIGPCDPRSDDLESDSAFRLARSFIDTAKNDFQAVLGLVGAVDDQVPVADTMDASVAVLRANALEKLGDLDGAVRALRDRMQKSNASGRMAIEKFVGLSPQLQLCPRSLPMATQGHAQVASKQMASATGGGVGIVLMVVGAFCLFIGLVVGAGVSGIGGLLGGGLSTMDPRIIGAALPGLIGGVLGGCGGPGLAGIIMIVIGYFLWKSGQDAAYLRLHGLPARGTVLNLQATGTRINNVPVMRIHLRVEREGQPPYEAFAKQLLDMGARAAFVPGAQVALRVHPKKPDQVAIESS